MGLLDGILQQVSGSPDNVAEIAQKLGIDPALTEKAVAALGMAHARPGDTVEEASAATGVDSGTLGRIVEQLGGEGGLQQLNEKLKNHPQLSGVASMLDRDGDGNPLDDVLGMAKGLFGKN
jgi:transposase-like protein